MYKLTELIWDKRVVYGRTMDIIIILIKRCSLTRVDVTALYIGLMTKTTLTWMSNKHNLNIVVYHYRLSNNDHVQL